jgi:hypothetical protein
MSLPTDSGYSIADGLVHTRHPKHPTSETPRKARTQAAVRSLDPDAAVCYDCYPQEKPKHGRRPVSRPARTEVRTHRPASSQPLPAVQEGVGTETGNDSPARIRRAAPASPGQAPDQGDPMPLLRPSSDQDESDHSGSSDSSSERRESGDE